MLCQMTQLIKLIVSSDTEFVIVVLCDRINSFTLVHQFISFTGFYSFLHLEIMSCSIAFLLHVVAHRPVGSVRQLS